MHFLLQSILILSIAVTLHAIDVEPDDLNVSSPAVFNFGAPSEKLRSAVLYRYSINLFAKINSSLTLSTFGNSGPTHWKLIKYVNESSSTAKGGFKSISLPIYNISNPLIRSNQLIRKEFLCKPNDKICVRLIIPNMNLKNMGTYSYQSIINNLDMLYVNYNISLFIKPIDIDCSTQNVTGKSIVSNSTCTYDQAKQSLSLPQGEILKVSCSALIAQNSIYDPAVDLEFQTPTCLNSTVTREMVPLNLSNLISNLNDNTNIVLYRITRTCIRQFTRSDPGYMLCKLVPKITSSIIPVELLPQIEAYDKLNVSLNVQYAPELNQTLLNQNRTLIVGINDKMSVSFTCPYESKPSPTYYWRLSYVSYAKTSSSDNEMLSLSTDKSDEKEHANTLDETIIVKDQVTTTATSKSKISLKTTTKAKLRTSSKMPRINDGMINKRVRLSPDQYVKSDREYSLPMNLDIGTYVVECKAQTFGVVNKFSEPVRFQLNIIRLDDLWIKKEQLENEIVTGQEDIERISAEISRLQAKLIKETERLAKNKWSKDEFEKIISKTQAAYLKIFEQSSKVLNI